MGCGSSSLKGDQATGVDEPARPLKQVKTNFSTVDYDADAATERKRRMTEYAPHETVRNDSAVAPSVGRPGSKASAVAPAVVGRSSKEHNVAKVDKGGEGEVKPFNDATGGDLASPAVEYPHEKASDPNGINGTSSANNVDDVDPTTSTSKSAFASSNDPANPSHQDPSSLSPAATDDLVKKERKKSWFGKRFGGDEKGESNGGDSKNKEINDEDMKKYTGKSKAEIEEMVREGKGVGRGQPADSRFTPGAATAGFGMGGGGA